MSTTSFFLLSLLCLGVANADHGGSSSKAEGIANEFLVNLKQKLSLSSGNSNITSDLVLGDFLFHGCKGDFDKKETLVTIANLSAMSFVLKSAESVSRKLIQFKADIHGLAASPVSAEFVIFELTPKNWVLVGGKNLKCAGISDGSQIIAEAFVGTLSTWISTKNQGKLAESVSEKFEFYVCKAKYNKKQLLAFFDILPVNSKLSLLFQSSEWIQKNGDIKLTILVTGFGNYEFQADFVIRQENEKYVLIGGKIPECDNVRFFLNYRNFE